MPYCTWLQMKSVITYIGSLWDREGGEWCVGVGFILVSRERETFEAIHFAYYFCVKYATLNTVVCFDSTV